MKKIIAVLCVAGCLTVGMGIYFLFQPIPKPATAAIPTVEQKIEQSASPPPLHDMSKPLRLRIPSLEIDTSIEEVGLTPEGNMAVPSSFITLGWYRDGAMPGNPGNAVLAGHTGYPNVPTSFRRFESLKKGDIIEVDDDRQFSAKFEVIETALYTPKEAPRERIFGQSPTARLVLITCIGTWIPDRRTYSHRLVVYAVRTG